MSLLLARPAAAAAAEAPGHDAFQRGVRAAQEGDFAAAVAAFERAREAGLDSPALYFNLGVAYYQRGRDDDAVEAFEAAIERGRMVAPSAYNLGRIAAERGDHERAHEYFRLALERAQTPAVRERARARLPAERPTRATSAFVTTRLGYDTNVTTSPEDLPNTRSEGDTFAEASAYLRRDLGPRWHVDAQLYGQRFSDIDAFDITSLRAGGGRRWPLDGGARVRAGGDWRTLRVSGEAFEDRVTVDGDYRQPLGEALRGKLGAEVSRRDGRDPFGFLDGTGWTVEAALEPRSPEGEWSAALAYSRVDRDDIATAQSFRSFSWHAVELAGDWRLDLAAAITLELSGGVRARRYDDPERREGRRLGHRDAIRTRLGTELRGEFSQAWSWYTKATAERRDADLVRFDYTRETIELGIEYAY